jgi:CheY-like chemotaxis protein
MREVLVVEDDPDLMMPIMNGWQFRHEQRQDSELSKIPVVVVSAKTDSAQHAAWLEADAYLEKPLSLGKLVEIVNRFCTSAAG